VRIRPGAARTILLFHIISARPPKPQPIASNRIPPNRQPATVGEEERGGRGTTSRRTSTREKLSLMEWRGKAGGQRPGGGGGLDGRLRIAALVNGLTAVRLLGSASLCADAVDHRRASSRVGGRHGEGSPGGRRPGGGGGRDGRRCMPALVNSWTAVRLLGSASLRADTVVLSRTWAGSGGSTRAEVREKVRGE
jgi:hypothetical protein